MLKPLSLSLAIVPLLTGLVSGRSALAQTVYPQVSDSQVDMLVCYMQTSDGRILQLERLCNADASSINRPYQRQTHSSGSSYSSSGYGSNGMPSQDQQVASSPQSEPSPADTALCYPENSPVCSDVEFDPSVPATTVDPNPRTRRTQ